MDSWWFVSLWRTILIKHRGAMTLPLIADIFDAMGLSHWHERWLEARRASAPNSCFWAKRSIDPTKSTKNPLSCRNLKVGCAPSCFFGLRRRGEDRILYSEGKGKRGSRAGLTRADKKRAAANGRKRRAKPGRKQGGETGADRKRARDHVLSLGVRVCEDSYEATNHFEDTNLIKDTNSFDRIMRIGGRAARMFDCAARRFNRVKRMDRRRDRLVHGRDRH